VPQSENETRSPTPGTLSLYYVESLLERHVPSTSKQPSCVRSNLAPETLHQSRHMPH